MRKTVLACLMLAVSCSLVLGADDAEKAKGKAESSVKQEVYEPKVIIEGKWGSGPGEFGFTMWEGSPDYARSFAINSKGNILIFDFLNNRIQRFDKKGKYLDSIPVESYRRATDEEMKKAEIDRKAAGKQGSVMPFATLYMKEMYIDEDNDNIYLSSRARLARKGNTSYRLVSLNRNGSKLKENRARYNKIVEKRYPKEIRIKNRIYQIEKENSNVYLGIIDPQGKAIDRLQINKYADMFGYLSHDNKDNVYVTTYVLSRGGANVEIFSVSGQKIGAMEFKYLVKEPFIDNNGNIWIFERLMNAENPEVISWSKGLRLIKWEQK